MLKWLALQLGVLVADQNLMSQACCHDVGSSKRVLVKPNRARIPYGTTQSLQTAQIPLNREGEAGTHLRRIGSCQRDQSQVPEPGMVTPAIPVSSFCPI
jgi:hypothetical protein